MFKFRLQKALEYREEEEERLKKEFLMKKNRLDQEKEVLTEKKLLIEKTIHEYNNIRIGNLNPLSLKNNESYLKKIKNEKELQAKKDAEAKALAEKERAERAEKAAQRKLAKAPDKDKMQLAIDSLTLSFDVKDEESKITSQKIVAQFESFKSWAKSEIEKL